ncbi:unnamed protein product [Ectocarpus sp. CCAP 1310/34]|nr:unnamed protein product [Ectocarpus sp. CCAP 1310/34]
MKPVGNGEGEEEEEEEDGEIQESEIPTNSNGQAATPGSTAGEALPHQGLQQIEQARSLVEAAPGDGGGVDRVKKLLVQSKAAYLQAASALAAAGEENTDVSAISQGAPQAALICVASEAVFPKAIALVRWFCSKHVASLCEVSQAMEIEAKRLEKQSKSKSKSKSRNRSNKSSSGVAAGSGGQAQDEGSGTRAERATRLLRVLISSFNAFLEQSSPGSGMFSTAAHVRVLDIAVSLARKAIERLSRECSADPSVGKAAARLRGLTAAACFASVSPALDGGGEADEKSQTKEQVPAAPNSDNLDRMGKKDVDKLLVCISGGEGKKDEAYLSPPCICVEAIGALRRQEKSVVATLAPPTYATIAEAFAAALRCMTRGAVGGPEGEWSRRPALNDANVRHTLFACCCHLAEGLPAATSPPPDDSRLRGHGKLVSALKACHVMRGFVTDGHPLPLATARPGGGSGEAPAVAAGVVIRGSGAAGIGSACASSSVVTAATSSTTGSASKTAGDHCAGAEAAATVEADCAEAAAATESAVDATAAVPLAAAAAAAAAAVESDVELGHEKDAGVVDARSSEGPLSKSAAASNAAVASLCPATGERTKAPPVRSPAKQPVAGKRRTGKKPGAAEEKLKGAATAVPAASRSEAAPPPAADPTEGGARAGGGIAESALPTAGGSHAKKRPRSPLPSPRQEEEGGRPERHGEAKRRAAAAPRGGRLAADLALLPARQQRQTEPRGGVVVDANATAAARTSHAGKPTPSASSKSGGSATPADEEEGPSMAALFGEEEDNEPESATAAAEADVEVPGAAVLAAAAEALAVEVAAATATATASAADTGVADGAMPSAAAAAAPATKSYPPLQTAPEKKPAWREGERYGVVLGESFYGSGGGSTLAASSKSGGRVAKGGTTRGVVDDDDTGENNPGQYVHLKYDFVPGRTNLDVPATLRQRPLTENEGRWRGRGKGTGGDVGGGGQQQRWAAEMEYESRDPSNPEPVRFTGDAVRAQDVECVLVFDGQQFVMDRVAVVGGLKNVQEFDGLAAGGSGGPTPEATLAKRKKDIKSKKIKEEKQRARDSEREAKAAKKAEAKAAEMAAKAAEKTAAKAAKAEEKAAARAAKAAEKAAARAARAAEKAAARAAAKETGPAKGGEARPARGGDGNILG